MNPVITAATAVILFILRRLGCRQENPLLLHWYSDWHLAAAYAKYDFAQPLASLLLLGTFLFLLMARDRGFWNLPRAGFTFGSAFLTRPELFVVPGPMLLAFVWFMQKDANTSCRIRRVLAFGLPVILFVILNQYVNFMKSGNPASVGYSPQVQFTSNLPSIWQGITGLVFSPGRSMLLFFPITILSIFDSKICLDAIAV
jgi:4-amino-4-deoxy-L-arabinose transferase-like glycosyltransferase